MCWATVGGAIDAHDDAGYLGEDTRMGDLSALVLM